MTAHDPFFTIGTASTTLFGRDEAAAAQFRAHRAIICRDALDAAALARLNAICDRGTFVPETVEGLGHRHVERPSIAGAALSLFLNRRELKDWLEQITGCGPIRTAGGSMVETHCAPGDGLSWHDDRGEDRLLAVTIAIGEGRFAGGGFQLRRKGSEDLLLDFTHDTPGTALIFDVAPELEHRVLPVTAGGPRRVFAGWFLP